MHCAFDVQARKVSTAQVWITGPAALPYLEDGPVSTSEDWNAMVESFGGNFGIFAVWFN